MARSCRFMRWSVLLPVLIGLAALMTIGGCRSVESSVRSQVLAALDSAGLDGVDLEDVAYRDVELRGSAGLEPDVISAVGGLAATRSVTYEGTGAANALPEPTTTVAPAPAATVNVIGSFDANSISMSGSVPDEAVREAVISAARAAYGDANVVDELTVDGAPPSSELSAAAADLAGLMSVFADSLTAGGFRLNDTLLSVTGDAPSPDAAAAVESAIGSLGGVVGQADLTVPVAVSIDVTGVVEDGAIALSGSVPDEPTRAMLVSAAETGYGPNNVADELTVDGVAATAELTGAAGDLAGIIRLLPTAFDTGAVSLQDTRFSIRGTATSLDASSELEAALDVLSNVAVRMDITAPAGEAAVGEIGALLATRTITFESGSAVITAEGLAVLDEVVPVLDAAFAADADLTIEIGGHTDSQGSEAVNLELSRTRAEAVRDYLVDNDIPGDGLVPVGYGETRPVADDLTSQGRQQNRRIEFTVMEG